jgi:predicted nucleic acid-binding protein
MAYNIKHIDSAGLQKRQYLFDANLWLKILKPKFNLPPKDIKYLDFFEKFKNHPQHPKIALTALILSEVINRYLRDVTFKKFCKKNPGVDSTHYKEVYRPSQQFQSDYISLCEDIKAYEDYYNLIPDGLSTDVKQKDILTSPPVNLDFNDLYYYRLALKHGFTIVTDDKDFFVEDVEILTYNNQLIEKAKAAIQIIRPR